MGGRLSGRLSCSPGVFRFGRPLPRGGDVRGLAIDGYQSVLDNFPDSVTYDATGTIAYPLAPSAYAGIEALGGTVEGGWVRIPQDDGSTVVVQAQ